jgi:hypothetical protein
MTNFVGCQLESSPSVAADGAGLAIDNLHPSIVSAALAT